MFSTSECVFSVMYCFEIGGSFPVINDISLLRSIKTGPSGRAV